MPQISRATFLIASLACISVASAHQLTTLKGKHHCADLHEAKDQCKHALKYCHDDAAGYIGYIAWYYCSMATTPVLGFIILCLWTALLFSTIGIASSDFFCPNLATIANSLGMSQSVAGVTLLALGNGSPDVFSTFAAFKANSGSLAIGELLGAAAFITSVVAGVMAIISPFNVSRRAFLRDAGFFSVAVVMTMFLLADGRLRLWESLLMIFFYVAYVAVVLAGQWFTSRRHRRERAVASGDETDVSLLEDDTEPVEVSPDEEEVQRQRHAYQDLNSSMSITGNPLHTTKNIRPSLLGALEFSALARGVSQASTPTENAIKVMRGRPRSHSLAVPALMSRQSSARGHSTNAPVRIPMASPDVLMKSTSVAGVQPPNWQGPPQDSPTSAIELSITPSPVAVEHNPFDSMADEYTPTFQRSPTYQATELRKDDEDEESPRGEQIRPDDWVPAGWPLWLLPSPSELKHLLLPSLCKFRAQSWSSKLLSVLAAPSVLVLTLTLPVVSPPLDDKQGDVDAELDAMEVVPHDDTDRYRGERGWNRWLTCVQALLAPFLLATTVLEPGFKLIPLAVAAVVAASSVGLLLTSTSPHKRPKYHTYLSAVGFLVSITWISTIASELVGVLQAFGTILGLSDAILGLTVFAVGSSLADFVADVTVARMGFSVMAFSATFGGPLMNILLGLGISGAYVNLASHKSYDTQISPTLIITCASLLTTLVTMLIAIPAQGYRMTRGLGVALIGIFLIGMIISILVELYY
ncbi:hypothetical protein PYCC9005_004946 [Savitreella phatthalungensis]